MSGADKPPKEGEEGTRKEGLRQEERFKK